MRFASSGLFQVGSAEERVRDDSAAGLGAPAPFPHALHVGEASILLAFRSEGTSLPL